MRAIGGHESFAKLAPRAQIFRADAGEACATRYRHKGTLSSLAEHMWCSTVDVGRGNGECRKRRRAPVRASERLVEGRQAAAWPGRDRLRRRRAQAVASAASACLAKRFKSAFKGRRRLAICEIIAGFGSLTPKELCFENGVCTVLNTIPNTVLKSIDGLGGYQKRQVSPRGVEALPPTKTLTPSPRR